MSAENARTDDKGPEAFRTISEVAEDLDLPQHVLRFWETRFSQIKPLKRGGGRRYYRPDDVDLLRSIRFLLYEEGLTIKGVQKMLREQGAQAIRSEARGTPPESPPPAEAAQALSLAELREALADLQEAARLLGSARRG